MPRSQFKGVSPVGDRGTLRVAPATPCSRVNKTMSRVKFEKAVPPDEESGKARKGQADTVYLLSLKLQNVRCFGDPAQEIDLSDGRGNPAQWTILLGDNGTGKTTLLQSLVL